MSPIAELNDRDREQTASSGADNQILPHFDKSELPILEVFEAQAAVIDLWATAPDKNSRMCRRYLRQRPSSQLLPIRGR
ncbi:MAG: hypothetical protein ACXWLK_11255, partial [Rhizomicrobium sp.]